MPAQAVCAVLAGCAETGIAQRAEPTSSPALLETRAGNNHHHLVRRARRRIAGVDCAAGARLCLTPGDEAGDAAGNAEVVFWDLAPAVG